MGLLFQEIEAAGGSFTACLLLVALISAVGCQSTGLIYSRQWYLLPVVIGLAGLIGFLMNPIADSNTLLDLQEMLLTPDNLMLLCTGQLLLSSACLATGLRTVSKQNSDHWRTLLGFLCCFPSPILIISVLFAEQQWLASQVGARPELAGIGAGTVLALAILAACGISALIKELIVLRIYIYCCLTLCALSGLATTLNQSLPEVKSIQSFGQMLIETGLAVLTALICIGLGFFVERRQQTRSSRHFPADELS